MNENDRLCSTRRAIGGPTIVVTTRIIRRAFHCLIKLCNRLVELLRASKLDPLHSVRV